MLRGKVIRSQAAFTLVEVIVVVFLIALMTAVAAPRMQDLGQRRNLEIGARNLATEMRRAQQRAVTLGYGQIIQFRHDSVYRVIDGKTEETSYHHLPGGVFRSAVNFPLVDGYSTLRFNYNGSPSSGGTVSLENGAGEKRYVIVAPATGRVRISEYPPENWEIDP